jgi:hypothetical protein
MVKNIFGELNQLPVACLIEYNETSDYESLKEFVDGKQ